MANRDGIKVVPNLVQGVTQQAPQQARDSQCLSQFDCINAASEGAGARPPTELVKMYPSRVLTGSFFSETSHDGENYLTGIKSDGTPFAIDLADGTDCTVNVIGSITGYLTAGSGSAKEKLRSQVAEDTTFITNREVVAAMLSTTSDAKVNEAIIFVRATYIRMEYKVTLSGPGTATSSIMTSGTNPCGTHVIAQALLDQVDPGGVFESLTGDPLDGTDGYICQRVGSVLRIRRTDGAAFTVAVEDGQGGQGMIAFNGQAQRFSDLPARCFPGTILEVAGESRTEDDNYFVRFTGSGATGKWVETVGPGVKTSLNAATLPHTLVNTAYRVFEFRRPAWSTRIAGDGVKTGKDPSFIGKRIRDVFYHQRRLGILTESTALTSKADASFTLFPDTVQTQLDTAPVDIKPTNSSGKGATSMDFAVFTNEKLYFWAQRQQHVIEHGQDQGFSQKTVSSDEASSYEYSPRVDPMPIGQFLHFSTDVGQWASLRALQFANGRILGDVDLSAHVPHYIPAGVETLTASETLRLEFVLSAADAGRLYVLSYLWDGQQFAQQAFNVWRIPGGDILWAGVQGNFLRILQQRAEGVAYLKVNLTPLVVDDDPGATYQTRLDTRLTEAGVADLTYDAGTGNSTFTLPYIPVGNPTKVAVRQGVVGGHDRGRTFEVISVVDDVVTVKGDLSSYLFYVGQQIISERTELEFFVRTEEGSQPYDILTLNRFSVTFANTGYSRVEVSASNGVQRQYVWEGRRLGTQSATTGSPPIGSGDVGGAIGHASRDVTVRIVNDSFLPSYWQNAAWEYTMVGWKGVK